MGGFLANQASKLLSSTLSIASVEILNRNEVEAANLQANFQTKPFIVEDLGRSSPSLSLSGKFASRSRHCEHWRMEDGDEECSVGALAQCRALSGGLREAW